MSTVLRAMENGTFNEAAGARALFTPGNPFQEAMQQIVAHWTIATGRDLKASRVSVAPTAPTAVRPTPRPIVAAPPASTNGRVAVSREAIPT
jgi:hypothetical protein